MNYLLDKYLLSKYLDNPKTLTTINKFTREIYNKI